MPDLDFEIAGAEVQPYAASPTLLFKLAIRNAPASEKIQAIMLRVQIRIEAKQRRYDSKEEERLLELFGEPHQWGKTLKSLLWTHASVTVPPFTESVVAEMPLVCTYDFDVVAAKYLHALEDGEIPLLFLFSGTVLYERADAGLKAAQIPWEKECAFRLPVRLWREMMERYFPNSAWLRLRKDVFDRLYSYKGRNSLLTWEDVFDRLLKNDSEEKPQHGNHRR